MIGIEEFLDSNGFKILSKDDIKKDYIYVEDSDGVVYSSRISHLRNKVLPSVQTAVDKNKWLKIRVNKIHGDKYDCSKINYIKSNVKVELICNNHGSFFISPNAIITKGSGCPGCAKIDRGNSKANSNEYFIDKANKIHDNKYDYSLCFYKRQHDKLKIVCPIHGEFEQTAKDHLRGHGCWECAKINISKARSEKPTGWKLSEWIKTAENSVFYDSFKVYIIEVFDENERFIKIGRTFSSVKQRFSRLGYLPYEYNIIKTIEGNPYYIFKLESKLKRMCKQYKYICNKSFNGMHECFTLDCLELLKDRIDGNT